MKLPLISRFSRDVTAAMLVYGTIAKTVFWEVDSIIMQNLSDILPLFCTPTWPSHHVDFENLQKWNFCKTKFSFLCFKETFPHFTYAELAILKFLRSLFLYISFKLYLGCKVSCCSGLSLMRKVKNLFLLVTFFLEHFCIHATPHQFCLLSCH